MSADQSIFSFELNETVHFAKGQEIAEIKGISLEPKISIQPYSDYISIRGVIELAGEYKTEELNTVEGQNTDFEEFDAKRYVERVTDIEENEAAFHHNFPVEISVPAYRINHLDDVRISIDAFDYELENASQLDLFATVLIHGINEEESSLDRLKESEEEQSAVEEDREELLSNEELDHSDEPTNERERLDLSPRNDHQAEYPEVDEQQESEHVEEQEVEVEEEEAIREQEVEEEDVPPDTFDEEVTEKREPETFEFEVIPEQTDEVSEQDSEVQVASDSDAESDAEPDRWPFKEKTQTLAEFFKTTDSEQAEQQEDGPAGEDDGSASHKTASREEANTEHDEANEEISSLSDIFRNTEEESYTKMRICIVQDEDTIETIAERFEVSPLQLIKQNELTEDFDVEPGQLLYIPSKQA